MLRDSHVCADGSFWHSSAGSRLAFGGKPLEGHSIPKQYGAIEPTAVFVPLQEILKDGTFELVTTEVFGPVQARSPESRQYAQSLELRLSTQTLPTLRSLCQTSPGILVPEELHCN